MRTKVPYLEKHKSISRLWKGTRCEIYFYAVTTEIFRSLNTQRQYSIETNKPSCGSNNVAHLTSCKTCFKQQTSSTGKFRFRFSNYKSSRRNARDACQTSIILHSL